MSEEFIVFFGCLAVVFVFVFSSWASSQLYERRLLKEKEIKIYKELIKNLRANKSYRIVEEEN